MPGLMARLRNHGSAIDAGAALLMAVLYYALRTAHAEPRILVYWLVAASVLAFLRPMAGLLVLIAAGLFIWPVFIQRGFPTFTVLPLVLAAGVLVRVAIAFARDRAAVVQAYGNLALAFAAALAIGSAISVVTSYRRYGPAIGGDAWGRWLWAPGTALLVLLAAVWIVRRGDLRPLVAAVGTGTAAAVVSLANWFTHDGLRDGPVGWMVGPRPDLVRLSGITYWATGLEALLIVPVAVLAFAALFAADRRIRLIAALSCIPLTYAVWLTYNRAGLLGFFVIAVIATWRIRRPLGAALGGGGLIAGVLLLPGYLAVRGGAVGAASILKPGEVLIPSDQMRLDAWAAAIRMWEHAPLLGTGFRSFYRLHAMYGSPILDAPHNEWLRFFAEGGAIAGVLGLLFLVSTAWWLARGRSWLAQAALAAFLCWALALSFNNILNYDQVSILTMTIVATGIVFVSRERRRVAEALGDGDSGRAAAVAPG